MEINYVAEFLTLISSGNYLDAAETLFVSQSTLSRHIKKLENELGVPLFDDQSRIIKLSRYGEAFLPIAEELVRAQDRCRETMRLEALNQTHVLRLGCILDMAAYGLTNLSATFRREHPNISLEIIEDDAIELANRLISRECELAIMPVPSSFADSVHAIEFTANEWCLVASDQAKVSQKRKSPVTLADIGNDLLILPLRNTFYRDLISHSLDHANVPQLSSLSARSIPDMLSLVSAGLGVSLALKKPVSYHLQRHDLPGIQVLDVELAAPPSLSLVYLKGSPLSNAAKQFIKYVQSQNIN